MLQTSMTFGRVWMRTKQNGIYTRWQKDTSGSNLFAERFHSLTVVQHDNVKFSENAQKVTMVDHLIYPEFVHQTYRCSADISQIAITALSNSNSCGNPQIVKNMS